MNRRINRIYLVMLALAGISFYASTLIPNPGTIWSQVETIFLLNAGMGALVALLYSIVRKLSFGSVSKSELQVDLRLPAAVVATSLALAFLYAYRTSGVNWLFVPVPALLIFTALSLHNIYPFRGTVQKPSLRPLTEDKLVKFVTTKGRLKRLAEFRAQRFSLLLSQAGVIGNPYTMAARSITQAIIAAVILVPAAALLGLSVWYPLALLVAVPALVYVFPEVQLRSKRGERQEGVERELPFFSILVNVLGSAGVPLYTIFKDVAETKIFKAIRGEALLVKRDVDVFGMDPTASFERLASYHPSRKFSTLLYGYTAKVRSGGDIPSYLQGESGSLLRSLEESWTVYASRAGIIGSMMITVFGVLPLLLLVVGIFSPGTSVVGLTAFTAVGVPTFTVLLIFMAGRMQPVGEEPLTGAPIRSLLLSLPGLALGLLTGEPWLAAASMLFLFFTVYGYSVLEQRREMREIDEALPEFMKDLMEFKRQEYDLNRALFAIAAHDRYTPSFDRLLSKIVAQLRAGTPLDEVNVDPRTRMGRMTLFILGQMSRSGGGTIETVYQLTAYTTKVGEMRRNTQAEMRPYMVLSYISPLLLAFGVTFIGVVLSSFSSRVHPSLAATHLSGLTIGTLPPQLFQVSDLLIVVSAAALGIIGAKMTDFTVKNTLRASLNVAIAVVATYALAALNLASLFHFGV
ncbi:MAG: type II secretion system F family protein [Nitrososphaerales archaeon]